MFSEFFSYTITGLFLGAAYSIAASGLVLTYATTRVFNIAHGAISMVMAFVYWELQVKEGLPTWLAVVLVLFVIAPAFGIVLERLVMRGLGDAPVSVSLVVTVGLFVFLIGLAQQFWPLDTFRSIDYFFNGKHVTLFDTNVQYHYLLTMIVSAVVAGALYLLLNRTRVGTAMRAAVDNRELLELFGARAGRVQMLSWATGSSLAALAGILLVAYTGVNDYYTLTFLVISAFAAAMLGRLQNLPLTFLGAILLGLGTAYVQGYYHPDSAYLQTGIQSSLPTFMLFAIVLFVPQVRLRVGQVKGMLAARVPSNRRAATASVGLLLVSLFVLQFLSPTNTFRFGLAAVLALVMLSLVLLTGYGGYVSLAQYTFVGVGAAVAAKMNTTSPLVLLLAALIAAGVGAAVALPVIRLTGLYLALATLAFGQLMEKLVFQADWMFGYGATLHAKRVSLFGWDFKDNAAYVFLVLVIFVVLGMLLLMLRRGAVGRLLIALRDSPAACGTLGLNQRWFRVAVFSVSAGMAGLAGALLAGLQKFVSAQPFVTLQNLPLLLVAVVAGVTSISGAFFGGLLLMLVQVLPTVDPNYAGAVFLVIGVGAILLGRDPNGLVSYGFRGGRELLTRLPMPPQLRRFTAAPPPVVVAPAEIDDEVLEEAQVAGHGVA
ncbi:MAG: branched-chain amino acid transport system permease protein livM [Pseudonocardiales bacterium]|nr:branched-chain amino acid transport system permease protein livM [Pseudonocardiales bacterium]